MAATCQALSKNWDFNRGEELSNVSNTYTRFDNQRW